VECHPPEEGLRQLRQGPAWDSYRRLPIRKPFYSSDPPMQLFACISDLKIAAISQTDPESVRYYESERNGLYWLDLDPIRDLVASRYALFGGVWCKIS
jgi:hypothetical protein